MKKTINGYVLNIFLTIFLLLFSYFLWDSFSDNVIASGELTNNLKISMDVVDYSYGETKEHIMNKTSKIILRNQSRSVLDYEIVINLKSDYIFSYDDIEFYYDNNKVINNEYSIKKIANGYSIHIAPSSLKSFTDRYVNVRLSYSTLEIPDINIEFSLK